jgi:signal peptidase I
MSGSGAREDFGSSPLQPDQPSQARETSPIPGFSGDAVPDGGGHESPADGASSVGVGPVGASSVGASTADDARPQAEPRRSAPEGAPAKKKRGFWLELMVMGVVVVVLALIVKSFAIQAFFIPSGSMQNTLAIGDRVMINKLVYHFRGIARGDIVVFNGDGSWDTAPTPGSSSIFSEIAGNLEDIVGANQPSDVYIKRVIGLPGDHVACCNARGQVTVNGVALSESSYLYPGNAPSTTRFNITVPAGRLWVMGDHRMISYDSRGHMGDPGGGTIPESAVMGRAFVIIWPPNRIGFLNIPATFSQPKLAAALSAGAPLELGFVGAVPITILQALTRRRLAARRARRRAPENHEH